MSKKNKRILVGLSGGVDSAVTAYLLKEQWYDVVCGFMKNYVAATGPCTTREDAEEAIRVANFLGIELQVFDFQKEYQERIINYIYEGYKQGITPNPDILCNSLVKFDLFLEKALNAGFDMIATGHYARIEKKLNNYHLLRWIDYTKDQSYFLSGLNQYQLSKSLFPLWKLEKSEVRTIAKEIGLPNADRKDSQGLCFIWNIPIKQFLLQKLPTQKWDIISLDGKKLGEHDGAWFFTIGQKRGLWLNFKAYVIRIDVKSNLVIVWDKNDDELSHNSLKAANWHWIGWQQYNLPLEVKTKIRYRQEPQPSQLQNLENNCMQISFIEEQRAIAPGQTVVAYVGDECVGNGVIL